MKWLKSFNAENVTISELWVNWFIKCHPELKSKYTYPYDHQHGKCEDPGLIKNWFNCVQETIQKYGISEQDIYNMDETGSHSTAIGCLDHLHDYLF